MEIGDRVQTLNTFVPITGEIVDMYKNLVTIADDDAETVDQLLSFHADDLEVISWTTKRFWSATKVKPKSMQTQLLNLASTTTFIINFFIVMTGIELFILIGGGYALYTVGMAIATEMDYRRSVDKYKREYDS